MNYISDPSRFLTDATIADVETIARHHSGDGPLRTYAFGDIHGKADLLMKLLDFITSSQPKNVLPSKFVFLGDYVDRGALSAQAIAIIRLLQELMPAGSVVALKGNHEDMLLNNQFWSYTERYERRYSSNGENLYVANDVWVWLENLPLLHEDEKHYYVHTGFNPKFPVDDQRQQDMMWIREEFLFSGSGFGQDFGKHVLHGHTPYKEVQKEAFRTDLDTGAVFGGFLTAAEIKADTSLPLSFFMVNEKGCYWDEY